MSEFSDFFEQEVLKRIKGGLNMNDDGQTCYLIKLESHTDGSRLHSSYEDVHGRILGVIPSMADKLLVTLYIATDRNYDQGTNILTEDGTWKFPNVHFGGIRRHGILVKLHTIYGEELGVRRITVYKSLF